MTATIIDGKAIAQELRGNIAIAAAKLTKEHGIVPGLAVVLVGSDPASEVYVKSKSKAVTEAGHEVLRSQAAGRYLAGRSAEADRSS